MEAIAFQLEGRRVGDFEIAEEIGHGGMGAAYRAEQVTLRREVVIKVIATSSVSDADKVRFLREARLASRLDHPYAAHVYAFGAEPDGLLWIAMELVRGVPLDKLLAEHGPLPLARFVPIFDRLCEVVHTAHEQGIIHRDIKPANVMVVRRAGRLLPKLLDFGIARAAASVELRGDDARAPADPSGPPGADTFEAFLDARSDAGVSVTVRGKAVGSPPYMAPEQWLDAARADARTDLYALAVTAYQLLTGTQPFRGATVFAIARAHAREPVPPLGRGLPAALDRVLARALAKRPEQRYRDVLELATEVRAAARDHHSDGSGDLDEVVRDAFVQAGPQPIAEALLELSAAREPAAAWDAIQRVIAIVIRCTAAIAIAARARVGEPVADDAGAQRIRALVERGLDLDEWLALVVALVEPFVARPLAHPVPELVTAFAADGAARRALGDLLARRGDAGDEVDPDRIALVLAELGQALRACAFLTELPWATATADGAERWSGPRRRPRDPVPRPPGAEPGSVWLLDADHAPVLELSPIVRIAPPAPGADDEAFVLDGPARRGARAVAWPRGFERHDEALWQFVDTAIVPLRDRTTDVEQVERAPYLGLATFRTGDAELFFGREREVEAVVNRLRVSALLAVVGPSGVGKSSFIQAGVVPVLPEGWQAVTVRPGGAPLAALEARLVTAGVPGAEGLAERMRADPGALRAALDVAAHRLGARLVLIVDQLEEMFTQCHDADTRDRFASALAGLADGAEPAARLVITLRDDFLVRAAELPAIGDRLAAGLELVTQPDPEMLRRIVVEPLRRVGYAFEDATLPDQMIASVRDHPGALPLLSFAAAKLWELRDRRFRHIPNKAYEAIGGVAGALARHAEDTLLALPEADRGLVRELFRHLVTSEGTRAVLRRDEALELLGGGEPRAAGDAAAQRAAAERVIEAMVGSRLIVGYDGQDGVEYVEVIHEALLGAWPRLVGWQREDAESARLRDQLRAAARQWHERGRPAGLLWRGEALVEYRLWRARHKAALTDVERAFTEAGLADERRSRRLRRIALAAVVIGLTVGVIVLQRANGIARRNAAQSTRVANALLAEQGRAALVAGKPQDAMVYLAAAFDRGAEDPNLRFLLGVTGRALGGELVALRGNADGVKTATTTPDGAQVITAGVDGVVKVWDAQTGAELRSFSATGTNAYGSLEATTDGGVLTFGAKEAPAVWTVATGARRFALATRPGAVARLAGGGTVIVTADPDARVVQTWGVLDGAAIGSVAVPDLTGPPLLAVSGDRIAVGTATGVVVLRLDLTGAPIRFATARPPRLLHLGANGTRVLAAEDQSREIRVWDVDRPDAPRVLAGHAGDVLRAVFSPDGSKVASSSLDHTAKLWDAASGRLIASLDGHDGYILPVVWSPDGAMVATGSIDRTARLWDGTTGAPRAIFYGHADIPFRMEFDRAGQRLVTASFDGTARVFSTRPPADAFELRHAGGPVSLRFSASSGRLLAVGYDGAAWVYDLTSREPIAELLELRAPVALTRLDALNHRRSGDLDPTGAAVVLPHGRSAEVIRLDDRSHPTTIGPHPAEATCVAFAPGGRIVIGGVDGKITVWSATGALERTIAAHRRDVTDLAVDPSTGRITTSSRDGSAAVFELATGAQLSDVAGGHGSINGVAISHDGARVAIAGQDTVARLFDVATGTERAASHSLSDLQDVEFAPDDRRIAVANTEGTAIVYDSVDGRMLARFGDTTGWATGVAFSPDGMWLAVGDDTGRIRVWDVSNDSRSPDEISRYVECHVPLVLVGTRLLARPIDKGCK